MSKKHSLQHKRTVLSIMIVAVLVMAFVCMLAGPSGMNIGECMSALFGNGTPAQVRIMQYIRLPRVIAAIIVGAGLSMSGLIMQTSLGNSMASPSTLGVTNAAVFGANLSIIVFAGGYLMTGNNLSIYGAGVNPYATSFMAFIIATISILLILGLCRTGSFSPGVIVLAGIAIGAVWNAATTVLQFYATDVGLSAAVIWNFGDLGRATYTTDAIMGIVVAAGFIYFIIMAWKYNSLLAGDNAAVTMGVNVDRLRLISLLFTSIITAVCVSYLGIIGFVGIICPHVTKKLIGEDHRYSIPISALTGCLLLLIADTISRSIGQGSALPVGAITSLIGAPFFIALIFTKKEAGHHHD